MLIFIELIRKNIGLNNLLFFLVFFICFFIPIKECDISPSNLECPQYTITEVTSSNIIDTKEVGYNNESIENTVTNQLDSVQF